MNVALFKAVADTHSAVDLYHVIDMPNKFGTRKHKSKKSLMQSAIANNHASVVQILLKDYRKDFDIDCLAADAIAAGSLDCLAALIGVGCDINSGRLLRAAVQADQIAIARFLLDAGASVDCVGGNRRETVLHCVVREPRMAVDGKEHDINMDMLQLLIDHKANVNARDLYEETPLLWAARHGKHGHRAAIDLLLKHNADWRLKNKYGYNALRQMIRKGANDWLEQFLDKMPNVDNDRCARGHTLLYVAVEASNIYAVDRLLERGADINMNCLQDSTTGHALLHVATPQLFEHLMERGARVQTGEQATNTLYRLIGQARDQNFATLLRLQPEVNVVNATFIRNETTFSLLEFACVQCSANHASVSTRHSQRKQLERIIDLLCPKYTIEQCSSALHFAFGSYPSTLEILLERGARLDYCDRTGKTLLHKAMLEDYDCENRLALLLQYADAQCINIIDDCGKTVLDYCVERFSYGIKSVGLVLRLLKAGADVCLRPSDCVTTKCRHFALPLLAYGARLPSTKFQIKELLETRRKTLFACAQSRSYLAVTHIGRAFESLHVPLLLLIEIALQFKFNMRLYEISNTLKIYR